MSQTIGHILSLADRADEQDGVALSTLRGAKGLEWPHAVLAAVNEGLLPFRSRSEDASAELTPERVDEERSHMYAGIARASGTLLMSRVRRRKKGR